jgi:hypothetical protein
VITLLHVDAFDAWVGQQATGDHVGRGFTQDLLTDDIPVRVHARDRRLISADDVSA